jgi:hypothetical protein
MVAASPTPSAQTTDEERMTALQKQVADVKAALLEEELNDLKDQLEEKKISSKVRRDSLVAQRGSVEKEEVATSAVAGRRGSLKGVTPIAVSDSALDPTGLKAGDAAPSEWMEVNDGRVIFYFNKRTKECRVDLPAGIEAMELPAVAQESAVNMGNGAVVPPLRDNLSSFVNAAQAPGSADSGGDVDSNTNNGGKGLRRTMSVRVSKATGDNAWEMHMDVATSLPFFYNKETGESQWDKPAGVSDMTGFNSGKLMSKPSMYKLLDTQTDQQSCWTALRERSYQTNAIAGNTNVKWLAYWDPDSNRHFYHNAQTDVSSWDIPEEWISIINKREVGSMLNVKDALGMDGLKSRVTYTNDDGSASAGDSESADGNSNGKKLKIMRVTSFLHTRHNEWECYLDEHHRMFYVNSTTHESTWEPPKDFGTLVATAEGIVEENSDFSDAESIQNVDEEDDLF